MRARQVPRITGGSGKLRKLGIPGIADRVVQAALKLVLEPIFEADFEPVSYGFRPKRRAHDAIAEIHQYGTQGYRWVLDADIEAAFDNLSHSAVVDRVRARVKDKRVLALVKAFLKAGVLTGTGDREDSLTGTPQGGILTSPTQWITSASTSRSATGGWSARGVPPAGSDISGSTLMSCMDGLLVVSMPSGSTRPLNWRKRASRRPGRPVSWRNGSGARPGRPAGMWTRRQHRAGWRFLSRVWCSPSSCRDGWRRPSGSTPGCRGGRSRRWWRRRWRSSWPGPAGSIPAREREGGRGGVLLRPACGHGSVGGLRHFGASAAGPHRAVRPGRKAAA